MRVKEYRTVNNVARTNPSQLARRVAEIYLGDKMTPSADASVVAEGRAPAMPQRSWTPSAAELARYAGRYESPELQTTYTLTIDNGTLLLHRRRSAPIALTPTSTDTFTAEGITYRFVREKGRLAGILVDAGRTRNLRFDRNGTA